MTGNDLIIRHAFKIERAKKEYTVYELTKALFVNDAHDVLNMFDNATASSTNANQLTALIRIEKDRNFHQAQGFDYWLRLRINPNWQKCKVASGLFKTKCPLVYYGDLKQNGKRNLLIFKFTPERDKLIIDYYPDRCPYHKPHMVTPELEVILNRYIG